MTTTPSATGSYTYAFGRIGVLQQLLLKQTDVDRLLGASDRKDLNAILTEMEMTSLLDQSLATAEEILPALSAWIREEVANMAEREQREVFNIIWLTFDAPLISYLIKKHHGLTTKLSQQPDDGHCHFKAADIEKYLTDGTNVNLSPELTRLRDSFKGLSTVSAQEIDNAVDRFIAERQTDLARRSGSVLIRRFTEQKIDMSNIRTALRIEPGPERDSALLPGGSIPLQSLAGERQNILDAVGRSSLPVQLASEIEQSNGPVDLEQACSRALSSTISRMWNIILGPEPIFAFAILALSHLSLIRAIIITKSNDFPPQEIKQIIPPFLPAAHYA